MNKTKERNRIIFFIVLLIAAVIIGCKDDVVVPRISDKHNDIVLTEEIDSSNYHTDEFNFIMMGWDDKDTYTIEVEYGGGCEIHEFKLIIESAFMESNPVQTNALLSHNSKGDVCRAIIRDRLYFNFSPLKEIYRDAYQTDHGTIIIHLAGISDPIEYSF